MGKDKRNSIWRTIYNNLAADGVGLPSYDRFYEVLNRPGAEGYQKRKAFYERIKSAGYDVGNTYEDFAKRIDLRPVNQPTSPLAQKPVGTFNQAQNAYDLKPADASVPFRNLVTTTDQKPYEGDDAWSKAKRSAEQTFGKETGGARVNPFPIEEAHMMGQGFAQTHHEAGSFTTQAGNVYGSPEEAGLEQTELNKYRKEQESIEDKLRKAYEERDRLEKEKERLNEEEGDLSGLTGPFAPISPLGYFANKYYKGEKTGSNRTWADLDAVNKQIRELEALRDKGGFWRGVKNALNKNNWDFGISDLNAAWQLYKIKDKVDKGEPLDQSEQDYLNHSLEADQAAATASEVLGSGYNIGQSATASLAFTAEFIAGGAITGNAYGIGRLAQKGVTKLGAKWIAKTAMNGAKKQAAKLLIRSTGLAARAATHMTADAATVTFTSGIAHTAGKVLNQRTGQLTEDIDGKAVFDPATSSSWGGALVKGIGSQQIENGTEYLGQMIGLGWLGKTKAGRAVAAWMGRGTLGKTTQWLAKVGQKPFMQSAKGLMERAGVNGLPQELMEEEIAIPLHAILGDDGTKISDLWDAKKQLELAGSVALSVGAMGAASVSAEGAIHGVPYAAAYYGAKRGVTKAGIKAAQAFTDEKWTAIRNELDDTANESMTRVMDGIINNQDYNDEQKQAAVNYALNLLRYRGFNLGQAAALRDGRDAVTMGMDNAFIQGHEAQGQQMNDIKLRKDYMDGYMRQVLGLKPDEKVEDAPMLKGRSASEVISDMADKGYTDEQIGRVQDWYTARAALDGVMSGAQDRISDAETAAAAEVDATINKDTGMIHGATMKVGDRRVYIVKGRVALTDDGKAINAAKSDKTIFVRDAATGKVEATDPTQILSLDGEALDPESQRTAAVNNAREAARVNEERLVNGTLALNEGDKVQVLGQDGNMHEVIVGKSMNLTDKDGKPVDDAVYYVTLDGYGTTMRGSEIQNAYNQGNLKRLLDSRAAADSQAKGNGQTGGNTQDAGNEQGAAGAQAAADGTTEANEATETAEAADASEASEPSEASESADASEANESADASEANETQPVTFALEDQVTVQTQDGRTVTGTVVGAPTDANGNQVVVEWDEPVNGQMVSAMSADDLAQMAVTPHAQTEGQQTQAAENGQQAANEQQEAVDNQETAANTQQEVDNLQESANPQQEGATAEGQSDAAASAEESLAPSAEQEQTNGSNPSEEPLPPMPMVRNGKNKGEPDWAAVPPARSHAFLYNEEESGLTAELATQFVKNKIAEANKRLAKLKKLQKNPNIGTNLAAFKRQQAKTAADIEETQGELAYWEAVKAEHDEVLRAADKERREREAAERERRNAEEAALKEQAAKEKAEREAAGANQPLQVVRDRWNAAPKIEGAADEIVLPGGEHIKGRYVLTESGAASPSHDSGNGFARTKGFPEDENGHTVNDRDYEHDEAAQQITRETARNYDQRALQSPVVVSRDGVVLSGNGRTMAGEIAAREGTDAAYTDYLKAYAGKYGFTREQMEGMDHPRVVFVPDADLPYTAETFAKFNRTDQKSQTKTEQAVKMGKVVDDTTYEALTRLVSSFETLGAFYNDGKATKQAVRLLENAGVVTREGVATLFDNEGLSATGTELLETVLIGKAFEKDPDTVRRLSESPAMRQRVVAALSEITRNAQLGRGAGSQVTGEDYSLMAELTQAVALAYRARKAGYQLGAHVSDYAMQYQMFPEEGEQATVADYRNFTVMMLADVLNDTRVMQLKKVLAIYNQAATDAAEGQIDMFTGGVRTKQDILEDVKKLLNNGNEEDQQRAVADAIAHRQQSGGTSAEETGSADTGSEGSGQGERAEANNLSQEDSESESASVEANFSDPREMSDAEEGTQTEGASEEEGEQAEGGETPEDHAEGAATEDAGTNKQRGAFEYFKGSIADLVKAAKSAGSKLLKKVVSKVSDRLKRDLSDKGVVIDDNYKHVIDNSGVNHALNGHGKSGEELRGQIPLTAMDFDRIDDIVNNYDSIEVDTGVSPQIIKYTKTYADGTTYYVEEIRNGRKELALKTMYKRKSSSLPGEHLQEPSSDTPAAAPGSTATPSGKDTQSTSSSQENQAETDPELAKAQDEERKAWKEYKAVRDQLEALERQIAELTAPVKAEGQNKGKTKKQLSEETRARKRQAKELKPQVDVLKKEAEKKLQAYKEAGKKVSDAKASVEADKRFNSWLESLSQDERDRIVKARKIYDGLKRAFEKNDTAALERAKKRMAETLDGMSDPGVIARWASTYNGNVLSSRDKKLTPEERAYNGMMADLLKDVFIKLGASGKFLTSEKERLRMAKAGELTPGSALFSIADGLRDREAVWAAVHLATDDQLKELTSARYDTYAYAKDYAEEEERSRWGKAEVEAAEKLYQEWLKARKAADKSHPNALVILRDGDRYVAYDGDASRLEDALRDQEDVTGYSADKEWAAEDEEEHMYDDDGEAIKPGSPEAFEDWAEHDILDFHADQLDKALAHLKGKGIEVSVVDSEGAAEQAKAQEKTGAKQAEEKQTTASEENEGEAKKYVPRGTPKGVTDAYESGDKARIEAEEKALRAWLSAETKKRPQDAFRTWIDDKAKLGDKRRELTENQRKLLSLVNDEIQNTLEGMGVPKGVFRGPGTRLKLAKTTTDPLTAEVLTRSGEFEVTQAVFENEGLTIDQLEKIYNSPYFGWSARRDELDKILKMRREGRTPSREASQSETQQESAKPAGKERSHAAPKGTPQALTAAYESGDKGAIEAEEKAIAENMAEMIRGKEQEGGMPGLSAMGTYRDMLAYLKKNGFRDSAKRTFKYIQNWAKKWMLDHGMPSFAFQRNGEIREEEVLDLAAKPMTDDVFEMLYGLVNSSDGIQHNDTLLEYLVSYATDDQLLHAWRYYPNGHEYELENELKRRGLAYPSQAQLKLDRKNAEIAEIEGRYPDRYVFKTGSDGTAYIEGHQAQEAHDALHDITGIDFPVYEHHGVITLGNLPTLNLGLVVDAIEKSTGKRSVLYDPETGNARQLNTDGTEGAAVEPANEAEAKQETKDEAQKQADQTAQQPSEQQQQLGEAMTELLRETGVPVSTDVEEMEQSMLDSGVQYKTQLSALTKAVQTIKRWITGNVRGQSFTLALPESTRKMIEKVMGRGFDSHSITANSLAHIRRGHGENGTKNDVKSIPLSDQDLELIPYIMTAPDRVEKGSTDISNRESLRFIKTLSNGIVIVVEKEHKNSPHDMETITMWAEMSTAALNARSMNAPETHVQNAIRSTDAAKIRQDAQNAIARDALSQAQIVWHGSPHSFEAFDHSHMGSGEGAQAHGYGTYVAASEGISRGYAERLSGMMVTYVGDVPADMAVKYKGSFGSISKQDVVKLISDTMRLRSFDSLKQQLMKEEADSAPQLVSFISGLKAEDFKVESVPRQLYEVEIPDDTGENYFDEQGRIGRSSAVAKRILKELKGMKLDPAVYGKYFIPSFQKMIAKGQLGFLFENGLGDPVEGKMLYVNLKNLLGSDKAASELLHRAGFAGIKYDGAQDGRCYVIFDEKDLKIINRTQYLRTAAGEVYGFVKDGKIYLDPRLINPATPVHEYTHLWDAALQKRNPRLWQRGKELMKQLPLWDQIKNDPAYADIANDEDLIASEVHARLSGKESADLLQQMTDDAKAHGAMAEAQAVTLVQRIRQWLRDALASVRDAFARRWNDNDLRSLSLEEFARMPIGDLIKGRNPIDLAGGTEISNGGKPVQLSAERTADQAETDRLAGEAAVEMLRGAGIEVVTQTEEIRKKLAEIRKAQGILEQMIVFHGSPHSFESFDHSHMGSGEGVQVHGWGTYVAATEGVSRGYAKRLSRFSYEYVGQETPDFDKPYKAGWRGPASKREVVNGIRRKLDMGNQNPFTFPYVISDYINENGLDKADKELIDFANSLQFNDFHGKYRSNLYEVEIPDDTGNNYLDERAPASASLMDALEERLTGEDRDWFHKIRVINQGTEDNGYVVSQLGNMMTPQTASELLHSLGYTGIKYDGAQDGRCYVIFDEKDLKIVKHEQFLQTPEGEVYGFVKDGKVYLDPAVLNGNTPVHEYTHLWDTALRQRNPKLWQRGKELMKGLPLWEEVKNDPAYADIAENEDLLASEVHARLSGAAGETYLNEAVARAKGKGVMAQAEASSLVDRVKAWLKDALAWVRDAFASAWNNEALASLSVEEFAKMPVKDLARGFNPNAQAVDGGAVQYSIREKPAPKKTGIGYKVFYMRDGKLYPPMVANPGGEATPVGVWLDADAAPVVGRTKTGRNQVKAGGKGTQGGSGQLAYRPGWHLGVIPYALQFGRVNPETGKKELFPKDFVWAEVEYAADKDYQQEAHDAGVNANGKYQHSLAGLPHLPVDGSYRYRTNPNPATDPWIITGAMRVKRVLTPEEVDGIVREAGREPQKREAGADHTAEIAALNREIEEKAGEAVATDNQGNPVDADGKLKTEKVRKLDDLTDEDFKHPTRNVELPALSQRVSGALGTGGKPVIIKKNIFEKNERDHADLTAEQSREILHSALYSPSLYGQNQKVKRPYNWVVVNTSREDGKNRLVLLEVNNNKENVEIVHWHYVRGKSLETIKRQAEREGGRILILPSESSEEAGGLSSRTQGLSSEGKGSKRNAADTSDDKELVAVHNLSAENLRKSLELGGLPMPSIAVTKAKMGHEPFGEISLVFDKHTIDPKRKTNRVYDGDAWTPIFPKVETKLDRGAVLDAVKKVRELVPQDVWNALGSHDIGLGLESRLNGGGLLDVTTLLSSSPLLKAAYLRSKGEDVDVPHYMPDVKVSAPVRLVSDVLSRHGVTVDEAHARPFDAVDLNTKEGKALWDELADAYARGTLQEMPALATMEMRGVLSFADAVAKVLDDLRGRFNDELYTELLDAAYDAERTAKDGGGAAEVDRAGLVARLNKLVPSSDVAFREWIGKLYEGAVAKRGIRNKKDPFTPRGLHRSWDALHDEVTLQAVMRDMLAQDEKGGGTMSLDPLAAAARSYGSLKEIREAAKKRLQKIDPAVRDEMRRAVLRGIDEVTGRMAGVRDVYGSEANILRDLRDALMEHDTAAGYYEALHPYYPDMTMADAEELAGLIAKASEIPARYFEAKPRRVVGLDEVKAAVVPEGTPQDLVDALRDRGIRVETYEAGNEADRQAKVDAVAKEDDLLFRNQTTASTETAESDVSREARQDARQEGGQSVSAMADVARRGVESLGLGGRVTIVTDTAGLTGARATARGWYDRATGQIVIVVPNHADAADVTRTLLHEAVAHYGLRQLLGGRFDSFLDGVYRDASAEVRAGIDSLRVRAALGGRALSVRDATEEYMAGLAERTDFNSRVGRWWRNVLHGLKELLRKALPFLPVKVSDSELRYVLQASHDALKRGGREMTALEEAQDVTRRMELEGGREGAGRGKGRGEGRSNVLTSLRDNEARGTASRESSEAVGLSQAEREELEAANARFNEELGKLTERNADSVVLSLGRPSEVLESAGVADKEMKLYGNKVIKKMRKHGFTLDELRDLPKAVAAPIAVFDNYGRDDNRTILTELSSQGRNLIVALTLGKKGVDVDFNIVSSVFGKNGNSIIDWINRGLATYIDKKKALDYLYFSESSISEAANSQELSSAAKVVENFVNPKTMGENISEQAANDEYLDGVYGSGTADDGLLYRQGATPQGGAQNGQQGQTPEPPTREVKAVREAYDKRIASGTYQTVEAMQDSMRSLKEFMRLAMGEKGLRMENVPDFENAYLAENALSSKNLAEASLYRDLVLSPLLDETARLEKEGVSHHDLLDYMIAKHGLERNALMRQRALDDHLKKHPDSQLTLDDFADRDFSGLTSLTGERDTQQAEAVARQLVAAFEKAHQTDALWERVNDATDATLKKLHESGILSRDAYAEISGMYDYYIPLRGFNATESREVYGYLTDSYDRRGSVMKTAHGRTSLADDPLATIAQMAEAAISQGNRNVVKQRLLNFVLNHPTDLVSVSDLWVKWDETGQRWVPVFPDLKPTDSAADVERKVAAFEAQMSGLKAAHPELYKHGAQAASVPYVVQKGELREHQILVKRGGNTYVLTVNGNPRLAQAMNGMTNPDVPLFGKIGEAIQKLNRFLSANYTSRSPAFVARNFARDLGFASTFVWVKENPAYAARFDLNAARLNPVRIGYLLHKWNAGTLDVSKPVERYFREFMLGGGETGYTVLRDVDAQKKVLDREVKMRNGKAPIRTVFAALGERWDALNRSVENSMRFTAYVTSREAGRSVERSIWDAKDISVNFNKKGAGAKFADAVGQTAGGKTSAYFAGFLRDTHLFWNPAIQATYNILSGSTKSKSAKAKAAVWAASAFALGAALALLGGLGGDDDDKKNYYNLPSFVRRNNLCFRAGDRWVIIPLSVEMRAFYGLGELSVSMESGNERYDASGLSLELARILSQAMPLDMVGEGGLRGFIPGAVVPLYDLSRNRSWTDLPIYKKTDYNKDMPEWTKAYSGTGKWTVDAARWVSQMTGGDKYKRGAVEVNPAVAEYLVSQYFGGIGTTVLQGSNLLQVATGQRDFNGGRDIPVYSSFVRTADERTQQRQVNNEYQKLMEDYRKTQQRLTGYRKDAARGSMEYAERLNELMYSPEMKRYGILRPYELEITRINSYLKELKARQDIDEGNPAQYDAMIDELTQRQADLRKEAVDRIREAETK